MRMIHLAAALLCLLPVHALASVSITSTAEKIVEHKEPDGTVRQTRVPAAQVTPGDMVVYTYRMSNGGAAPAERVIVTAAMTKEMALQRASVSGAGFDVSYSVDGGRSFGALEALTVRDANGRARLATADDVTHIRWIRQAPLAAGTADRCGFAALVR